MGGGGGYGRWRGVVELINQECAEAGSDCGITFCCVEWFKRCLL